jgi:uncharacterized protein (TIGR03382 family)
MSLGLVLFFGIIAGSVVIFAIVAAVAYWLSRRRRG